MEDNYTITSPSGQSVDIPEKQFQSLATFLDRQVKDQHGNIENEASQAWNKLSSVLSYSTQR